VTSFAGGFDGQGRYYYASGTLINADVPDGLLRLEANGEKDTGFGDAGVAELATLTSLEDFRPSDLWVTGGGDIVVTGSAGVRGTDDVEYSPGLVSINSQGTVNPSFGPSQDGFFIQSRYDTGSPSYEKAAGVFATSTGDLITGFVLGDSLDLKRLSAQGEPKDWSATQAAASRVLSPSGYDMVVAAPEPDGMNFGVGTATGARLYNEDGTAATPATIDMGIAPTNLAQGSIREDGRGGEMYALGAITGGGGADFERYDAQGQLVDVGPTDCQPDFGWAGTWEWVPNRTQIIGTDDLHLWFAGVKKRERTDGTTDFRVAVWRVWRY
jgi:hypothetical protein